MKYKQNVPELYPAEQRHQQAGESNTTRGWLLAPCSVDPVGGGPVPNFPYLSRPRAPVRRATLAPHSFVSRSRGSEQGPRVWSRIGSISLHVGPARSPWRQHPNAVHTFPREKSFPTKKIKMEPWRQAGCSHTSDSHMRAGTGKARVSFSLSICGRGEPLWRMASGERFF